jgi:Zinc carboxypeptidase
MKSIILQKYYTKKRNNSAFLLFKVSLFLCIFCLTNIQVKSQEPDSYYLPQNVVYDKNIPTPQQFLGYQVGDWHIPYYQLVNYLKKVDELSDRFTMVEYGHTHEAKPLYLITITSKTNHANIDQIKKEHHALVEPDKAAKLEIKNMPLVTWMGYSVHGNEASGTNAVPLVAYYLAAAQGAEIDKLLNETVILIDPRINPDGGERFATWVNANKSNNLVSDPNSRELNEWWPGGRFNHYYFDLNRDWLYTQHPESQGRIAKFHEWKPNILTDHHEMGSNSSFFFQPGIPERTHPLTPKKNIELTEAFGKFQAESMNGIKSLYFTKEGYDDFYYGKGSTFPDVQGAMGILFEQASSRGHLQETQNGLLSFPFTIKNQFIASLATLKASLAMRNELLAYQRQFFSETNSDATKAYVFGGTGDKWATAEMVRILRQHEISVYGLEKTINLQNKQFQKSDSYIVPTNQPNHRLIKGIFEKRTSFDDSLFYDISAWSMPHCMNVPYGETTESIPAGTKLSESKYPVGQVIGRSEYAYIFEWDAYLAPKVANLLQEKGYILKVATLPFQSPIEGNKTKEFGYGTVLISSGINTKFSSEEIFSELSTLGKSTGVDFYGIQTGLTPMGIDLGSSYFSTMRQPKALMIVGNGVNPNDAGEIWHLLDTRIGIPLTMADIETVNKVNLSKYNTLILSSGNYASLNDDKIKRWVTDGGTIISLAEGAEWAIGKGISTAKLKKFPQDTLSGPKPYALAEKIKGAQAIPGTILEVKIDQTHPICYGYKQNTMSIFKDNSIVFEKIKDPYNAPLFYTEKPLISGYITPAKEKFVRNNPSIITNTLGQGKVIAMADNPNFRAFWYGTNKLFLNTLFFSAQIQANIRGGE